MPLVKLRYPELCKLLGRRIPREKLLESIPMLGADLERIEGDEWGVEFFPNRPDLYSPEGVARALRAFLGIKPGLREYRVGKSDWTLRISPSVRRVRPVILGALVDSVRMTDDRIQALMELQEDLHWGLGARRRKASIGVHDRRDLRPPLTYAAVAPESTAFVPLGETKEMTLREILEAHPKGKDFAHLLQDHDRWPLITDAGRRVLSFPPIINGHLTTVTPETRDIFIDVTGADERACRYALHIVATHLAEQGGRLRSVALLEGRRKRLTPDLAPEKWRVRADVARGLIGLPLKAKDVAACLRRMGHGATVRGSAVAVQAPPYRADLLHEVDLVEDVAVGYGYWRIPEERPRAITYGRPLPAAGVAEAARELMSGLGYQEVMTLSLSNDRDQLDAMGLARGRVTLQNPITEEHTCVRISLLPSLLGILRRNVHRDLPQGIFEVGDVVELPPEGVPRNIRALACVRIAARTGFSEAKGLAQAVVRDLGLPADLRAGEHAAFIPGRCAVLVTNGEEVGVFGEVHPRTLGSFGLGNPVIALELRLPVPPVAEA